MTKEEALHRAAALCSMAEKCEADIRTKLKVWGIEGGDAEKIVQHLRKEKYIDDERYCRAFVNDKLRFAGWGRVKIGYALRQKGIKECTIDEMLSNIDEESYEEGLVELLKNKKRSIRGDEKEVVIGKLVRFAQGRGYELGLAIKIAKMITK